MARLDRLERRISTAEDLQSVVRMMKTLSAVGITQYQEADRAIRGYMATVERAMQAAGRSEEAAAMPRRVEDGPAALVAVGSDFGLCGSFNEDVVNHARAAVPERGLDFDAIPVLVLGVRLEVRWEAEIGRPTAATALPSSLGQLGRAIDGVVRRLEEWQQTRGVRRIYAVHQSEQDTGGPAPRLVRVAPVTRDDVARLAERPWPGPSLPMTQDAAARLLPELGRQMIFARLYGAAAMSRAAEYAARLAAMRAAERNIDEKLGTLRTDYRIQRQDAITSELLDVVSGYEASAGTDTAT